MLVPFSITDSLVYKVEEADEKVTGRYRLSLQQPSVLPNRNLPNPFRFLLRLIHLLALVSPPYKSSHSTFGRLYDPGCHCLRKKLWTVIIWIIMNLRRFGGRFCLKCRNIAAYLPYRNQWKEWRWTWVLTTLYWCRKYLPDSLFILKLDFCLCRMNIHIDISRIHFKINKRRSVRQLGESTV